MQFDYKVLLGITSSFLIFLSDVSYIFFIIKGKIKPHLVTWGIWTIATTTIFIVELNHNAGPGAWGIGTSALMCATVTSITIVKKIKQVVKKIDIALLIVSIFALSIWYLTSNPLYSVIILTTIDIFGYIPTIRKTYYKPHHEHMMTFTLFATGNFLSLFSLTEASFINRIYQMMSITASLLIIIIKLKRSRLN